MSATNINRRAKGEQTRNKILEAAIEVIARLGVKGTTHRAVALQADTQLSLTTYYFKDIKELVKEAISLSSSRFLSASVNAWAAAFELMDSFDAATLRKTSVKEDICSQLSRVSSKHLYNNIIHNSTLLAVEQVFLTETLYSEEIKDLAEKHISGIVTPFTRLASYFNKIDPEIDAELGMIALTRIEYKYLSVPKNEVNIEDIERLVKRQLGYMMGLKRQ